MKKKSEIISNKWKIVFVTGTVIILISIFIFSVNPYLTKNKRLENDTIVQDVNDITDIGELEAVPEVSQEKELFLLDYEDIKDNVYIPNENNNDDRLTYYADSALADSTRVNDKNTYYTESYTIQDEGTGIEDTPSSTSENNIGSSDNKAGNIIDESSVTIKDETIKNEYKGEESQGPIEFFDVEPSGEMPKGDTPASGEHIGRWN